MRRLLIAALFSLLGSAAAAACEPDDYAIELAIQDFGTAWFNVLHMGADQTSATLAGGVCMVAPGDAWSLEADSASVTGLQLDEAIVVSVTSARLRMPDWEIHAELIVSTADGFEIHEASFVSGDVEGTVTSGRLEMPGGTVHVTGLDAAGTGYRLMGEAATFSGSSVQVAGARITTCMCPGEPFYELVGTEAELDLVDMNLVLHEGSVQRGSATYQLPDPFSVSSQSLQDLEFPLSFAYYGSAADPPAAGKGLAVLLNPQELAPGLHLGLGLSGLDRHHPLNLYGQIEYAADGSRILFGVPRGGGYRAEFRTRQPLNDWLGVSLATTHRHYADADYLHDGTIGLMTTLPALETPAGGRMLPAFEAFMSVSSQAVGGTRVTGPRLGVSAEFSYRAPPLPVGQLALITTLQNFSYPLAGAHQYAVRLRPSWSFETGDFSMNLAGDWRHTNSGSPFTANHDRLAPLLGLSGAVTYAPEGTSVGITFSHNFLRTGTGHMTGFENLLFHARTELTAGDWTVRPAVRLQLAGWLDPRPDSDRRAFIEGAVSGRSGDFELGALARYRFAGGGPGFETLQLSAALPLQLEEVKLVPFLALELKDLVAGTGGLSLAGHGLVINWDSCCGMFEFGYRLHDGDFSLRAGASFVRRRD